MKTSRRIGAICGLCLGICLLAFVWHKSEPGNHPAPAPVVAESPQSQQSPQQAEAPRERTRPRRAGVSSSVDRPAPSSSTAARLRAVQDELEAGDADAGRLTELAAEQERLTAELARERGVPLVTLDGARLSHFDGDQPVYLRDNNANASISIAATQIRSTSPYNVTGSGVKIGLWEVDGLPRGTHNDLTGRVTYGDSGDSELHATHVAGTVSASAKGMAPDAAIEAYIVSSYSDHSAEIDAIAATGEGSSTKIYLSNQSYGTFSDDGDASNDYVGNYGRYSIEARELDTLAIDGTASLAGTLKIELRHRQPPSRR